MGPVRSGTAAGFAGSHTRALALIAATALVALSLGAGVTSANSGRPHVEAENTFTKYISAYPAMAGVVGGDVGAGTYAGEILKFTPGATTVIEALYHFSGSQHSFTALVHVVQTGAVTGSKAVISGVVTEGWLKGNPVKGEYTQITCPQTTCYQGTLDIMQAFKP